MSRSMPCLWFSVQARQTVDLLSEKAAAAA